jgi:hypothetical protein
MDAILELPGSYLPFSAEPIRQWSVSTDIVRFIAGTIGIEPRDPVARGVTASQLRSGRRIAQRTARDFEKSAREDARRRHRSDFPALDLTADPAFGLAAKYQLAWGQLACRAIAQRRAFSTAHLMESMAEISCSRHLAQGFYYKQALQILRNFLEEMVLSIYFQVHPDKFAEWRSPTASSKMPPVRGTMLPSLSAHSHIPAALSQQVGAIYEKLNGYTHGHEARLLHRFHALGPSESFDILALHDWCDAVTETLLAGIGLLQANVIAWGRTQHTSAVRACAKCGNADRFSIQTIEEIEGRPLVRQATDPDLVYLACDDCGLITLVDRASLASSVAASPAS